MTEYSQETTSSSSPPRQGGSVKNLIAVVLLASLALTPQVWNLHGQVFAPYISCEQEETQLSPSNDDDEAPSSRAAAAAATNDQPLLRLTDANTVIFVMNRRDGFDVRRTIRETWATGQDNVYFVVGQPCKVHPTLRGRDEGGNPNCQVAPRLLPSNYADLTTSYLDRIQQESHQLQEELEEHQDVLIADDVLDTYRSLPQKLKAAYSFVSQRLPNAQWIVKVDDDFYMRVAEFSNYLQSLDTNTTKLMVVGGDIRDRNTAHLSGKWNEVPQYPRGGLYPPFPLGSMGHAVTRGVVEYIVKHQQVLFDYQGEDVSVGIWLKDAKDGVEWKSVPKIMVNHGNCQRPGPELVIGHDVTPAKMRQCYASSSQREIVAE
jgi:hypothetical protein